MAQTIEVVIVTLGGSCYLKNKENQYVQPSSGGIFVQVNFGGLKTAQAFDDESEAQIQANYLGLTVIEKF